VKSGRIDSEVGGNRPGRPGIAYATLSLLATRQLRQAYKALLKTAAHERRGYPAVGYAGAKRRSPL